VLDGIEGRSEVTGEQLTGQPVLQVRVDPQAIARYGVPTRNVLNVVEAVGTKKVGEIREGQRRFPPVVRLRDRQRTDPDALANTLIQTATGSVLPLNRVATVVETEGPATINRECGKRHITVQCNVRERDVGSVVAEAQRKITEQVKLPEGYSIEWGGQFENMQRANQRLMFIALSGVAILNGLILVEFIKEKLLAGAPLETAVREGCLVRLRPVLMGALVAALGFVPMAINVGVGDEVPRPPATLVIGGVITNTLLTLVVLPTLYTTFRREERAEVEV